MFLTTNRVGTFDDAFISRIHLTIYYEDLGEKERQQIWKQFFAKLEKERKDDIIVKLRAKKYVLEDSEMQKIPWNGREIRNGKQLPEHNLRVAAADKYVLQLSRQLCHWRNTDSTVKEERTRARKWPFWIVWTSSKSARCLWTSRNT